MIPYLLVLLVPCLFALTSGRKISLPLWIGTFILYILFVGLRHEVAPDWYAYSYMHVVIAQENIGELMLRVEPLSHILFWISENMGMHVYFTNVIAAFILIFGVFRFALRTAYPWLAVVSATPYFILVTGMSGVRQIMAAGVMLFLLSKWEQYSLFRRGVYILIAALFHTSALINNMLLITKLNIPMRYKMVIGSLVLLLTFYLTSEVDIYAGSIVNYKQRYVDESEFIRSFGSVYHILMIAIPAFLGFFYRKRIADYIHSPTLLRFGLYASLALFAINLYSPTVASRLTLYMYFVPMMVYPALVNAFGKGSRLTMIIGIIAFHILILVTWFSLGNVARGYIPYKNVLFSG